MEKNNIKESFTIAKATGSTRRKSWKIFFLYRSGKKATFLIILFYSKRGNCTAVIKQQYGEQNICWAYRKAAVCMGDFSVYVDQGGTTVTTHTQCKVCMIEMVENSNNSISSLLCVVVVVATLYIYPLSLQN